MALYPCPTCKKKVSINAQSCPKCGEPLDDDWRDEMIETEERNARTSKRIFIIIVLIGGRFWFLFESGTIKTVEPSQSNSSSNGVQNTESDSDGIYWVTIDRLNRRTCPATTCGIVGRLIFREGTSVREIRDGWARISPYYSPTCVNGQNEYVDTGDNRCTTENGVVEGRFAEWVSTAYLSQTRPPDPADGANDSEALVSGSDDFRLYRAEFVAAANSLIAFGMCKESDFREWGGWIKSTNHSNRPIYFMYCGTKMPPDRFYLDVNSGDITR